MAMTSAERLAKYVKKRKAQGMVRITQWCQAEHKQVLDHLMKLSISGVDILNLIKAGAEMPTHIKATNIFKSNKDLPLMPEYDKEGDAFITVNYRTCDYDADFYYHDADEHNLFGKSIFRWDVDQDITKNNLVTLLDILEPMITRFLYPLSDRLELYFDIDDAIKDFCKRSDRTKGGV